MNRRKTQGSFMPEIYAHAVSPAMIVDQGKTCCTGYAPFLGQGLRNVRRLLTNPRQNHAFRISDNPGMIRKGNAGLRDLP